MDVDHHAVGRSFDTKFRNWAASEPRVQIVVDVRQQTSVWFERLDDGDGFVDVVVIATGTSIGRIGEALAAILDEPSEGEQLVDQRHGGHGERPHV